MPSETNELPIGETIVSIFQVICPIPSPSKLSPPLTDVTTQPPASSATTGSAAGSASVQQHSGNNKVTVRALYDFEMKDEEKEDCLKFKKVRSDLFKCTNSKHIGVRVPPTIRFYEWL